jgi:hypothetical protein
VGSAQAGHHNIIIDFVPKFNVVGPVISFLAGREPLLLAFKDHYSVCLEQV